jgi:hypothetical protein
MNELNPFEQDLADRLRRQAQSLDIGDTPMATVVRRGRHRNDRRKVAFSVAAVATLSGTAIGSIQLLSRPESHKVVPATDSEPSGESIPNGTVPASVPGDELTPVARIDSNLVWNVVEPGSSEALGSVIWDNSGLTGQRPPYLAWSSAPGQTANQEFVPTLYRSDDGIHWQPAGGQSFTQPDISMRGVGTRNGRMFAFGTAAATAPIPNGGGGEVVVDVSDDQGASWRDITLPIDLRGLADSEGVQSVGFQGDMVASDAGVVAIGVPLVNLDQSIFGDRTPYIARREGAIGVTYPSCGRDVTATTVVMAAPGYATTGTAPAITAPADTTPAADTTTTNVGVGGTEPADVCTADSTPIQSDLIPWSDLGVDATAVAAMFTPRVFVSTDGETFVEGSFPTLADGFQIGQLDVTAIDTGFIATAQLNDPFGGASVAKLYTSADGMTWTESDMPSGMYNVINVLSNGTVVAFGNDMTGLQPFTAISTDGVEWSKMTLANLLDPEDGASAQLNVWLSSAGPGGITAVAGIWVDAAIEAGGLSVEKDGVRLTITESRYQSMVATDVATGEELGRWDGRTPPAADAVLKYNDKGEIRLLDADGNVRVTFTDADMQGFYDQQATYGPKTVVLHSTDGMNWSRDDVKPLVGFDTFGATRVQVTDSNVLVSMVDSNSRDAEGTPKTVVLVGTPKS